VLCAVAAALRDNLRAGELPARIGGDEFAVVAEVADAAAGHGLAQRLRGVIDGVCAAQQVGVPVSASIGVAVGPAAEADRLVRDADRAMYEEKHRRPRLVPGQR
jgi:diguanylate cyclase (GGDEF)-like protein